MRKVSYLLRQFCKPARRIPANAGNTPRTPRQQGVVLIITLVAMMIIVLLVLSLLVQSSTDHLISINEQDTIQALSYAEAALDMVNRKVIDYAGQNPAPANLSDLLDGPDNAASADDHLIDLAPGRVLDVGLDSTNFNTGNEQTASGVATIDGLTYQVFRIGTDSNNDAVWDGPRALVHVRIDDNYDGGTQLEDTDFRMQTRVIADYPIYVDSSGVQEPNRVGQRGVARRHLAGKFGPLGHVAIRTNGDLEIHESLEVCGECGGVHSNGNLDVNGADDSGVTLCATATGTMGIDIDDSAQIRGGAGVTGPVFIPVINPYDDLYVPLPATFDHSADTELDTVPDLKCPLLNTTTDPGASKYFALIAKTVNNDNQFQVYKAYWNGANNRWVWRLIDQKLTNFELLDARLDNCGRVVSSRFAPADPLAGLAVVDGGDSEFYGFRLTQNYRTANCNADNSLSGTQNNDFNLNAFPRIADGAPITDPLTNVAPNGDTSVPPLPGTLLGTEASDGIADFLIMNNVIRPTSGKIAGDSSRVYSPMYNAVLFLYGNADLSGNLNDFAYYESGTGGMRVISMPNGRWRVSIIGFNNVEFTGNPAYGPANASNYQFMAIAGRDIDLGGTPGCGEGCQTQCPENLSSSGTDCTAVPATPAAFAGVYAAHEQIRFHGNTTLDGYIIAEDAANCGTGQTSDTAFGSVQVHYDCEQPPDFWATRSVRLLSWEEIQR